MADLNEDEKVRLVKEATALLQPLAARYEMDDPAHRTALFEAFQLGIQFSLKQTKRLEEELQNGQS